jgi:hypothetical protein
MGNSRKSARVSPYDRTFRSCTQKRETVRVKFSWKKSLRGAKQFLCARQNLQAEEKQRPIRRHGDD